MKDHDRSSRHPNTFHRDPELFVGRRDLGDRVVEVLRRHQRVRLTGTPYPETWRRIQQLVDGGVIRLGVSRKDTALVALRGRKGVAR